MPVSRKASMRGAFRETGKKEKQKMGQPKKKKTITIVISVIVAAAVILTALVLGGVFDGMGKSKRQRDRDAAMGQLPYKSEDEVQDTVNRIVEEGMFNISINSNPTFADGKSEGNLGIENIQGNHYLMQVSIVLDDTGQTVYESGLIEPGYFIEKAKLNVPLAAGNYPATAVFTAVNADNEEDTVGTGAANILISIQN